MFAQAGQGLFERVGGVRIIDDHQRRASHSAHPAHPAIDRRQSRKNFGDLAQVPAQRQQCAGDRQQVVYVETAEQRRADLELGAGIGEHETQSLRR